MNDRYRPYDAADQELLGLKVPPHSEEAEQSVLGALLLDNQALDRIADVVGTEDFYNDKHRRIWKHLVRLIESNRPADTLTVHDSIEASDDRGKTGGPAYLGALAQNTPSALNVRRYAEIVREKAVQRRLAQVGTEIAERALSPAGCDVSELLDESEQKIFQISEARHRRGEGPVEVKPLLAKVFERIDHLYHRDDRSGVTGVPTGLVDLDQRTAGLQPGDLIIVAARPSMGKTALALNIAEYVAVDNGLPALVFSMEMSGTQLATRLLGSVGHIDQHKLRTGRLNDSEWSDLSAAMAKLHEVPLEIDEGGALTALEVRARARRWRRKYSKVGLVIVDYLQLMQASSSGENRATDIAEITRTLKAMAKELDCPVVALSQLSRKVDERPDKRPIMSDLRESGAIEQDADVILFLYRESVYKPDLPEGERGLTELIIGKQRNGPTGTVPLLFRGQFTRFENYASPDGSTWVSRRPHKRAGRVSNFNDYKAAASGPDA